MLHTIWDCTMLSFYYQFNFNQVKMFMFYNDHHHLLTRHLLHMYMFHVLKMYKVRVRKLPLSHCLREGPWHVYKGDNCIVNTDDGNGRCATPSPSWPRHLWHSCQNIVKYYWTHTLLFFSISEKILHKISSHFFKPNHLIFVGLDTLP